MNFKGGNGTKLFWAHWAHLAVRHIGEDGIPARVLDLSGCLACRRLWTVLTPVRGEKFPCEVAGGLGGLYVRADVVAPPETRRMPVDGGAHDREEVSVARVRRFTDWQGRRPLERY